VSIKNRFVAVGLLTVIAVLGWFGLAFRPAQSRLNELNSNVSAKQSEVAGLRAQLERLIGLKRNETKVRVQAARMATALPSAPNVPDFIIQLQNAANAAGIDFLSISPSLPALPADAAGTIPPPATTQSSSTQSGTAAPAQPAPPSTPLRSISVQITADGSFFEIEQFILKMEHLARALRIDDLSLNTGGQDSSGRSSKDVLSATIKLQMFMVTPQAAAGSATGTAQTPTSPGA
jgi:Tfp pilus assembly protein PilO